MHYITKNFDFCYGHRVWTQQLDAGLSCNQPCKCRHLHGHQGQITIELGANKLDSGMVTDFHHLNWFKQWLDDHFDHKMIMDVNDPFLRTMIEDLWPMYGCDPTVDDKTMQPYWISDYCEGFTVDGFHYPNTKLMTSGRCEPATREFLEGLVLVEFVPTSENLAEFFFKRVQHVLQAKKHVVNPTMFLQQIIFKETPKTSATFSV